MSDEKTEIEVKRDSGPAIGTAQPEWEPLHALRHQIDRMMADFDWPDLRHALHRSAAKSPIAWPPVGWPAPGLAIPPVDLVERNGGYELQAELPGLTGDQIEVKLSNGMITIKGEKSSERIEDESDYHLRERSFGSFQRSFRVPANVDPARIEARFDKGVLKVTLPKSAAAIENERKIEVKAA